MHTYAYTHTVSNAVMTTHTHTHTHTVIYLEGGTRGYPLLTGFPPPEIFQLP